MAAAHQRGGAAPARRLQRRVTGDRDTGRALVEHRTPADGRRSPDRCAPAWRSRESAAARREARTPRAGWQGPRRRSSTTRTSRPRSEWHLRSPATSTPARTAPPRPGCWQGPGSTTTSWPGWPSRPRRTVDDVRRRSSGDDDALVPPVNNANQLDRVLESSCSTTSPSHAEVVAGGHRQGDLPGFYLEPTVDRRPAAAGRPLIQKEIFGPVITVQRFTDEDEALAMGQRRASTASRRRSGPSDVGRAMRMAKRLDFGCVWINTHIPLVCRDAARRLQALGVRQGPVDVRVRGLHPHQARDAVARLSARSDGLDQTAAISTGVVVGAVDPPLGSTDTPICAVPARAPGRASAPWPPPGASRPADVARPDASSSQTW